jgi:hypothetical protein
MNSNDHWLTEAEQDEFRTAWLKPLVNIVTMVDVRLFKSKGLGGLAEREHKKRTQYEPNINTANQVVAEMVEEWNKPRKFKIGQK